MLLHFKFFVLSLLLSILNTVRGDNVALNKLARQSTTADRRFPASRAVNGVIHSRNNPQDISHTFQLLNQYWTVDLAAEYFIQSIVVYNRADCCEWRLQKVYILTSNQAAPSGNLHPTSSEWTIVHYIPGIVADHEPIPLYLKERVRHVAVFSQHNEGVELREVEVFDYQYIEDAPLNLVNSSSVRLSSTLSDRGASHAADSVINLFDDSDYSSTQPSQSPRWWSAQLTETCNNCVVKIYPHLREESFPGGDFSRLSRFRVMSNVNQNPGVPSTGTWSSWQYCGDEITAEQNGPIRVTCSRSSIRHVSVYKIISEVLELIEVQVFHPEPAAVTGLHISVGSANSGCVNLNWNVHQDALYYRWRCNSTSWSGKVTSTNSMSCGHSPGTSITCSVFAVSNGGMSLADASSATLPCIPPSIPQITLNEGSYVDIDNARKHLRRLSVNLREGTHNCISLSEIIITVYDGETEFMSRPLMSNFYQTHYFAVYPNTDYKIVVTFVNNQQLQSTAEEAIETSNAVPDLVASFSVTGKSSDCVQLSWTRSMVPASIDRYEYQCSNNDQKQTSSTVTTAEVCGYTARTRVSCWIRAVNSLGTGDHTTQSGLTLCGAPTKPSGINVDPRKAQNDRRFTLGVTWQSSVSNCDWVRYETNLRKTGQPLSSGKIKRTNSVSVQLDNNLGATEYTIRITAINNDNRTSDPLIHTFTTDPLVPDFGESKVTVEGTSLECVKVSWQVPEYPNGIISNYRYSCDNSLWKEVNSSILSLPICDFEPRTSITCAVQAKSQLNRWSDSRQDSGYTLCGKPSNVNYTVTDSLSSDKRSRYLRVNISSEVKHNCRSISKYEVFVWNKTVLVDSKESQNRGPFQFNNLNPFTEYEIRVVAYNDADVQSDEVVVNFKTGEAIPGSAQNFIITTNTSCARLTWEEPSVPNGIITNYQISCIVGGQSVLNETVAAQTNSAVCDLDLATELECSIKAENSVGYGLESTSSKYTHAGITFPLRRIAEEDVGTIKVELDPPLLESDQLSIKKYWLIAEKVQKGSVYIEIEHLKRYGEAQENDLSFYVAGELRPVSKNVTISFVYGDGKYYRTYHNVPLDESSQYRLHYLITVLKGSTEIQYLIESDSVYQPRHDAGKMGFNLVNLAYIISGLTILIILIIMLVVVIKRVKYKQQQAKEQDTQLGMVDIAIRPTSLLEEVNGAEIYEEIDNTELTSEPCLNEHMLSNQNLVSIPTFGTRVTSSTDRMSTGYLPMSDLEKEMPQLPINERKQVLSEQLFGSNYENAESNQTSSSEKKMYEELSKSSVENQPYEKLPESIIEPAYENSPLGGE